MSSTLLRSRQKRQVGVHMFFAMCIYSPHYCCSVVSRDDRRASTPAMPAPHEVIEILDSDEELPSPAPPQLEIKPEPKSGKELPRRKIRPGLSKPGPAKPSFRVDADGALVLDSSDDDDPPARTSTAKENPISVQEKEPSPERRQEPSAAPTSPLLECKPSPPTSPVLWSRAHPPDHRMLSGSPSSLERHAPPVATPPPLEDVDMSEDAAVAFDAGEILAPADFEMEEGESELTSAEVLRSSPKAMQEPVPRILPTVDSPDNVSASVEENLPGGRNIEIEDGGHTLVFKPSEHLAGAEAPLRDVSSIPSSASAHEVGMDSISEMRRPPEAAQPSPALSTASSSTAVASLRAETASPVSGVLDPGLQGLVITEGSNESPELARSVSGTSSPSSTAVSTPGR